MIHKDMTIEEILTSFPQRSQRLAQEMMNAGLNCVGCGASVWETLEAGMLGHGFGEPDLEKLLNKLNAILEEKIDTTTITLTPKAAEKFMEILEDEGNTLAHSLGLSAFDLPIWLTVDTLGKPRVIMEARLSPVGDEQELAGTLLATLHSFSGGLRP